MTLQDGAYPGFCCMKGLGVFILPLDGMLVHYRAAPSIESNSLVPFTHFSGKRHCESE